MRPVCKKGKGVYCLSISWRNLSVVWVCMKAGKKEGGSLHKWLCIHSLNAVSGTYSRCSQWIIFASLFVFLCFFFTFTPLLPAFLRCSFYARSSCTLFFFCPSTRENCNNFTYERHKHHSNDFVCCIKSGWVFVMSEKEENAEWKKEGNEDGCKEIASENEGVEYVSLRTCLITIFLLSLFHQHLHGCRDPCRKITVWLLSLLGRDHEHIMLIVAVERRCGKKV